MTRFLVLLITSALALAAPAAASERHPTLNELEGEVMCPVCGTTLDMSSSPAAAQIERFISRRIAAGDTKSEIKASLVASFGPQILATPPRHGFGLLAWLLPLGGIVAGGLALALLARSWTPRRPSNTLLQGGAALDHEAERRLDEELARFDG